MRRVYHAPLSASTSRFGGTWPARTVPASASRARVVDPAGQVGERPADVGGDDAEQRLSRRCEEADVEVAVQEQRRDAGAVQDVLQVVRRAALPFEGFLKLTIERRELFVERLQLLPR